MDLYFCQPYFPQPSYLKSTCELITKKKILLVVGNMLVIKPHYIESHGTHLPDGDLVPYLQTLTFLDLYLNVTVHLLKARILFFTYKSDCSGFLVFPLVSYQSYTKDNFLLLPQTLISALLMSRSPKTVFTSAHVPLGPACCTNSCYHDS